MRPLPDPDASPGLDEMRTFAALAAAGSFAGASARLGRDPTAISRRLRRLERRLGVSLADWNTRTFALTEAGETYLSRILPLLDGCDAAAREAAALGAGEPRGRLRAALPGSFARLWLEPLVLGFMESHPGVTLEASYTNRFVDLLGEGFDVAVRLGEPVDSRLLLRKVAPRRRLVCAAPDYLARRGAPDRPEALAGHQCLCFTGRADPFHWVFTGDRRVAVGALCRIASDDADLLVGAALRGMGLFYTTDWHVGPALASGALVEVLSDFPIVDAGSVYVLTPSGPRMPAKTRAFSDWIAKGLAAPPWNAKTGS